MRVKISWTNNASGVLEWEIHGAADSTLPTSLIGTVPGNAMEFIDESPLSGQNFYRVRGKNGNNFTPWSTWANVTVPIISGGVTGITAVLIS